MAYGGPNPTAGYRRERGDKAMQDRCSSSKVDGGDPDSTRIAREGELMNKPKSKERTWELLPRSSCLAGEARQTLVLCRWPR